MSRAWSCLLLLLALAACSPGPMDYIPAQERSLLQAQARLGSGGTSGPGISVSEMLRRARGTDQMQVELRFSGNAVQPDEAQKAQLLQFASQAHSRAFIVTARRGGFEGADGLLGQRRAVAVARVLEDQSADVQLRFVADMAADRVSISASPSVGAQRP